MKSNSIYCSQFFYALFINILKNNNKPTFVVNDVFFEFDSFLINKSFGKYLDLIIDQIKLNNSSIVEINGHTDNIGENDANMILSKKLAESVKRFLGIQGIDKIRLQTEFFGESEPISDNTTASGRQKNRRVEFKIIFD